MFRSKGARKDATRGTAPVEVRKDDAALIFSASGSTARAGVLPGGSVLFGQGTAGFSYQVNSNYYVTTRGLSDGVHIFGNDGAITLTLADDGSTLVAPGSGLQRYDIAYALHHANLENADTDSEAIVAVKKGTAASTALPPSIPTGAVELFRNLMTSAATSTSSAGNTITQGRYTAVRGTPLMVRNQGERDDLAGLASPTSPIEVLCLDLGGRVLVNRGSGWEGAWTALTLASGWTVAYASATPEYRIVEDMWELRGAAYYAAGLPTTAVPLSAVGQTPVPASYGLNHIVLAGLAPVGARFANLNPRDDGGIRLYASATGGTLVALDGVKFRRA